jgi:hypothetical protein
MPLNDAKISSFLDYKKLKLATIFGIESKRFDDLKDARSTVFFKYALSSQ